MSGLHSKAWSPRPSPTTTSSLASARTRQISTSLDKVHSRIERPCCSPKYGSPKLQRRVSSGKTSHPFLYHRLNPVYCFFGKNVEEGLSKTSLFRFHSQTGWGFLQQGSQRVEPNSEAYRREWRLRLGSLHHNEGQPCPERPHRWPLQPF